MKKSYLTFLLSIGLTIGVNAQNEKEESIRYVYNSTTTESLIELKNKTKGDRLAYDNAIRLKNKYEKSGVIFLSSKEFEPIKKKVNSNSTNEEDAQYIKEASKKYMVITDLLK